MDTLSAFIGIGVGFWIVVAIFAILIVIFSEEAGAAATLTVIAAALFLQFIARWNLVGFFKASSILALLTYAGVYVACGLVWSVIKWTAYTHAQRRKYDTIRAKFLEDRGITDGFMPAEMKSKWELNLQDRGSEFKKHGFRHFSSGISTAIIPNVRENKAAIIRWMTYWPFSLVYTLLNDPVRRLFEFLYEQIGTKLQTIANHAFRGTEKDFLTKEERANEEAAQRLVPQNPDPLPPRGMRRR